MNYKVFRGSVFDALPLIKSESVDLVITSPPYWGLRSYGVEGELGAEPTLEAYLDNLMRWVKECWRVLKPSGSFVLNLGGCYVTKPKSSENAGEINKNYGDKYSAHGYENKKDWWANLNKQGNIYKSKQFLDLPAFAYQRIIEETDFVCRNRCVWCKPNVPSPIRSRLKQSTESVDWFVKDAKNYFFNAKPWLKSVGRAKKSKNPRLLAKTIGASKSSCFTTGENNNFETIEHSWRVVPVGEKQKGFELYGKKKQEHVAPFPEALVKPWIESLTPPSGTVLDPFLGSGTVMKVARDLRLNAVGVELNEDYAGYAMKRVNWGCQVDDNTYELVEAG